MMKAVMNKKGHPAKPIHPVRAVPPFVHHRKSRSMTMTWMMTKIKITVEEEKIMHMEYFLNVKTTTA